MAFRTVVIAKPADLHVHSGQLVAIQNQTTWIPTEDIAALVIEDPQVRISSAALSLLAEAGVAVLVCDRRHMPSGLLLPHGRHSRQLAVTRRQLGASLPLRKRMWQTLVAAKIRNQAHCLDALQREGGARLREYADGVLSGDSTRLEATAARYYFQRLMPGIGRHSGEGPDGALDYGYAILRAALARALVGHGLYPPLGIHHDSQLNPFNLADDFLEPYRPFADLQAIGSDCDIAEQEGRAVMLGVLNASCRITERLFTVLTAIEQTAVSCVSAFSTKNWRALRLPVLTRQSGQTDRLTE